SYSKNRRYSGDNAEVYFRFDRDDRDQDPGNRMNFNLKNLFQAKLTDSEKEKKLDLFTLDFSSSVNFKEKDRPIAPLRTTLYIKPVNSFKVRLTSTHSFYHKDDSFHLFSPYLDNLSITTDVGVSQGQGFMGMSSRDNSNMNLGRDDFDTDTGDRDVSVDRDSQSIPIKLRFSHSYGIRRSTSSGKDTYRKTHNIKPNLSFSPSRNFSISYYCQYDFERKSIVSQRMIINRDIHCWEANISWVPSGIQEGFYFKVNIKELPDVKIEKRRGTSGISY
ncbi:hypothetical protein ACFL1R_11195, partial [Candidatus Latescibacterota bacterium]